MTKKDPRCNYDAWGVELKFEPLTIDGVDTIRVISAGPDKQFGTPDDIAYPTDEG